MNTNLPPQHGLGISLCAPVYAYRGRYGPEGSAGAITVASLKCGTGISPSSRKEIFLVVDLSGSMKESIPALQASLRAFRDTIINRASLPDATLPDDMEKIFRDTINVTLIGYSDVAWIIYSTDNTDPSKTWDQCVVDEIREHSSTNIGAGVKLAFDSVNKDRCSWIVVMSDGMPNVGLYQSAESFISLAKNAPPNTRIVTLGYGDEFNAEVMCNLGEFTYIATQEQIPLVFGSLVNEVMNAWGFNASWHIKGYPGFMTDLACIIGAKKVGVLYNEREYMFALKVPDAHLTDFISYGVFTLSFTSVKTLMNVEYYFRIKFIADPPPLSVRQKYYAAAKGRRLNKFHRISIRHNKSSALKFAQELREELKGWTEECALPHKEELLRLMEEFEKVYHGDGESGSYQNLQSTFATRIGDSLRQFTCTVSSEFSTSQQSMCIETSGYATKYM